MKLYYVINRSTKSGEVDTYYIVQAETEIDALSALYREASLSETGYNVGLIDFSENENIFEIGGSSTKEVGK